MVSAASNTGDGKNLLAAKPPRHEIMCPAVHAAL